MARTFVRAKYKPANSISQMNADRARLAHMGPSANKSMAEFLVSEQLQEPVLNAAGDIGKAAIALANTELTDPTRSHAYENSIEAVKGDIVSISGNPRVSAAVIANGGRASWTGFTNPESSHAVAVEFDLYGEDGGPKAPPRPARGRRILARSGMPWHTERRPR